MNSSHFYSMAILILILLGGCGGSDANKSSEQSSQTLPAEPEQVASKNTIHANFKAAKNVVAPAAANASGQFIQPSDGEVFTGNILAAISATDPDSLVGVALSFNESEQLKFLCDAGDACPTGTFNKTETSINPADYGVYIGPLTMGLWTLDTLGNQMLVDSVTLDWQLRRILGASVSRSSDGSSLTINWQNNDDLLRYNVLVAAEQGINLQNYANLAEGQALLSVTSGPQTISGLNNTQEYYVLITGVDGSGESSFSSEFRLAAPSGLSNTPPLVTTEIMSALEEQNVNGNVLSNDSDSENDPLSLSPLPVKFPLNGDVSLSRNGNFSYLPKPNFYGTDSFVYEVQDGQGGITQGTVNITIDNVNDAPVAAPDSFSTAEDQTLTINASGLLANDSDIDGDTLQVNPLPITNAGNGTLILQSDGGFTYTPNLNFVGNDFFIYQVTDPLGLSSNARVDIIVGQANAAPIAVNDSYRVNEDQTLSIAATNNNSLLANDSDPEGDPLQLSANLIATVNNGLLTVDNIGGFTYIPNGNFFGNDSFTYQINDGQGNTAQATATIIIDPVNDAPTALDDNYSTALNTTLNISAPGLLSNDTDPEQDSLAVLVAPTSPPQNGVLNLIPDGSFVYTPNNAFSGQDSFSYQITDGRGANASAQVLINVENQQVILGALSLTTSGGLTLEGLGETLPGSGIGQVRYILGNCLQTTSTECTLSGTYQEAPNSEFTPNATGSFTMVFTYAGTGPVPLIAASNSPGSDTVSFTDLGGSLFTLTLSPETGGEIVAHFPAAIAADTFGFSAFLEPGSPCTGLLAGQSCGVGQVGLTPGASITGNVQSFSFAIPDPVLTLNGAPIANNDTAALAEDNSASINVIANDTDPENDILTVINASVDNGEVTIESNNQLTYTPPLNFNGNATITYTISDNNGNSDNGSVAVTIVAVNDQPNVVAETGLITNTLQTMVIDALANDSDVEQDTLTLTDASTNAGTVSIINNQLYFSAAGIAENTTVEITYMVSDGSVGSVGSTATVVVGNRLAEVNPDDFTTLPNSTIYIDDSIYSPAPILIDNDSDLDPNDSITYLQQSLPVQNGTYNENLTVASAFDYTPDDFIGIDGGFYQVSDGSGINSEGLFTIQVSDINWYKTPSAPDVPLIDFIDLSFDGFDYALFNNDTFVTAPIVGTGKYYAISGRMILSSTDKTQWQIEYATNSGNLKAIASGYTERNPLANTHIAVGNAGTTLVNQTGSVGQSHWLEIPTGLTFAFNNIAFDGQQFVAVGLQTVAFSKNGYSWSSIATVNSSEYRDVIFAGEQYVIVGDDGNIETSADGRVWQTQSSGITEQLTSIAHNGSLYVAVGANGIILSSGSGSSWQTISSGVNTNLKQLLWDGSQFVAVGDNNTVLTSSNGTSWTLQGGIDTSNVQAMVSDGTNLLLASDNGDLFTSPDAVDFTPLSSIQNDMHAIASNGGNTLVRAGNPSYIHISTDNGTNWTPLFALGIFNINEVNYFNNQFIAVGNSGLLMTSADGSNWTTINTGSSEDLNDIFWFSGLTVLGAPFSLYVAVGNNATILTSSTGTAWTTEVSNPAITDNLLAVTHDDQYFVAVGENGRLIVRNNSILPGATTWMDLFSNASWGNLNDVFFNGTNCVIVGDAGQLVTGTAATAFTGATISPFNLYSVSGNGNKVIAVGQDGVTLFSRDGGGSWYNSVQGSEFNLWDVYYHGNSDNIYTVGDRGTFLSGTSNIN